MTKAAGSHIAAAMGAHILGSEIRHGELMIRVRRDSVARVLKFLRDDSSALRIKAGSLVSTDTGTPSEDDF